VQIVQVFEESPAQGSGMAAGDVVANVDGSATAGLSAEEVAALMRGKKGTKASVRVTRGKETLDFVVTREPFKLRAVTSSRDSVKGQDIAFISIRSFDFETCDSVVKALVRTRQRTITRTSDLLLNLMHTWFVDCH